MYPDEFDQLLIDGEAELAALPTSAQVAYCMLSPEAEVNNGGFHQYFSSSSGRFFPQALSALSALSAIGAVKTRALLEKASSIAYPNGYPNDPIRHEVDLSESDDVFDQLDELDDAFYQYEEPLTELVNAYLSFAGGQQAPAPDLMG